MPKLTLLTSAGNIHNTGGLNWGSNLKNHTRKYDAYIPIHLKTVRANPGFFNPKTTPNPVVQFVWDDGTVMHYKFEGTMFDNWSALNYPKQISPFPHKDELGRYLRKRIGIKGTRSVMKQDLTNYGRYDIDLTFNPVTNQYFADFR